MALGLLFKGRETRFTDRMTVARLVLLQQPVADQKLNATPADLDRCDHVTKCYYDINRDIVDASRNHRPLSLSLSPNS